MLPSQGLAEALGFILHTQGIQMLRHNVVHTGLEVSKIILCYFLVSSSFIVGIQI